MTRARRLPGIQIDVAPPPAAEALPRMDVAVFVGFASTGPLHRPVAVESPAQYAAVFGGDAPLARDARRGMRLYAHLGASVRAFFGNGGRRCWVIRVAHSAASVALRPRDAEAAQAAIANRFPVPGMLALADEAMPASDALSAAMLAARCEGAWSDGHALSSALQRRGFAIESWTATDSPAGALRGFACRQSLVPGDLLMIGDDADACAYLRVERIVAGSEAAAPYAVDARLLAAFARERIVSSPSAAPASMSGEARMTGGEAAVPARLERDEDSGDTLSLRFDGAVQADVRIGQWIRFDAGDGCRWLRVDAVEQQAQADGGSPDAGAEARVVSASGPAWRVLDAASPEATFDDVVAAQLLSCELRCVATAGGAQRMRERLRDLALTPLRPGHPWALQRDDDYHRARNDASVLAPEEILRFPLAPEPGAMPVAWLPLGVGAVFGAALPPLAQAATALERDGLVPFDATLFLDPELRGDSVDLLLGHAEDIRMLRAQPRDLFGVHATLGIGAGGLFGETSLIAVPDAMHLGWQRREDAAVDDGVPPQPVAPAHWAAHRGACLPGDGGTREAPDFGVFLDCGTRRIDAPLLDGPRQPMRPGAYRLAWTDVGPDTVYALHEATLSDFADAREVYRGTERDYVALSPREGVYRYRVVAHQGRETSAASDPLVVVVRADEWVEALPDDDPVREAQWLAIHRALLRMSAACGDLFAALSMPRHFETAQVLRYVQRLRGLRVPPLAGDADAFGFNEARATSYGALYHPWLQSAARGDAVAGTLADASIVDAHLRALPPDGFTTGVLAARASERGAWIAAANAPMRDVVALATRVPARDRQPLQDAQVNLLRDDPRGFFALSADTLAHEDALLPINVRRLLILLRRLALRRGTGYVFEPNGPILRRAIQRGFDLLLGELYARGAFAGATPSQAFRVVTDEGINTPVGVDAGRLFVELRVAPSLPMRFIAVRLAQSGERLSVSEEL